MLALRIFIVLILLSVAMPPVLWGHEGVHVDIDRITAEIAKSSAPGSLYLLRARLCRVHGRPDLAVGDLEKARGHGVDLREEMLERAGCLADLNRPRAALVILDRMITRFLKPSPRAFSQRARLRVAVGERDGAIIDLARALSLTPDLELYLLRGRLLEERGAPGLAASCYRQGLEALGGSVLLVQALISAEVARGGHDEALRIIDEELADAVVATPWLLRRSEVLRSSGREEEAQRTLRRALKEANRVIARRSVPVHRVTRARILRALGDLAAARRDLEIALETAPGYQAARELLAAIDEETAGEKED